MKKITLLAVAAIAVLSMTSCKKDRVCTCTTTFSTGGTSTSTTTMYKVKKHDARIFCVGDQTTTTNAAGTTTGDKTTCELK